MRKSHTIALAAITAAMGVIFLSLGAIIEIFDLTALLLASVVMQLPLAKRNLKSAFLCYGAIILLSLLFTFTVSGYRICLMYAMFFGLHPIINYIEKEKGLNKIIMFIVKAVWFIGTLFLMYYVFTFFVAIPDKIERFIPLIISFGGLIAFFVYDNMLKRMQVLTDNLIKRFNI